MKRFVKKEVALAVALSLSGTAVSSLAIADDDMLMLEEIVVTAQKREQNLQDVPVAITAIQGDSMAAMGVTDISDLQAHIPNISTYPARGTSSTLTAYIRGIGQSDPLFGVDPGVGLYFDDVYIARPQGALLDVFDVERVEVLRGPQGTLYGKNTIGGAIKYVTKKMSGDSEGKIKLSLGTYGQQDIVVSGQLPIVDDTLYVGASVARFNRDGFGENVFDGKENYNKDIIAGRVSVEWSPTEELFIRVAADSTEDNSNQKLGTRLVDSLVTGESPQDEYDSNAGFNPDNEVTTEGYSLTAEWDVSENFTFKSVSSYREGFTMGGIDFDATPMNSTDSPVTYEDDQTTQEFQVKYESDAVKIVGGLYYYSGEASGQFDITAGLVGSPAEIPGQETAPSLTVITVGSAETESKAAYLDASFDVTEDVSLTAGGRYTQDEKTSDVYKGAIFAIGPSDTFGGTYPVPAVEDLVLALTPTAPGEQNQWNETWSQFSPKVGAKWKVNEDTMVYYSYSEGFKSGGVNMRADVARSQLVANEGINSQIFSPEEAKTHEIGLKSEVLDGRVRFNAAYFSTDYTSVQQTVNQLTGTSFIPDVLTDNEQEIQGIELETTAAISESITGYFNFGWTDAEWTKFGAFDPDDGSAVDIANVSVVSNSPEFAGVIGFNHDISLGETGHINWGLNYSYTDEIAPEILAESEINSDAYGLLGLSINWVSASENIGVSLHGKNLTDERYTVAGYRLTDIQTVDGNPAGAGNSGFLGEDSISAFYGDPRTVTLTASYKF